MAKTQTTKLTVTVTVPVTVGIESLTAKQLKALAKELKSGFEGNLPDDFTAAIEGVVTEPNADGAYPEMKIGKIGLTIA